MKALNLSTLLATLAISLVGCSSDSNESQNPFDSSTNAPVDTKPVDTTPVDTKPVDTTPVEPAKFTLSSNVMSNDSKLPLEHYCKTIGGQELVPNLSWANFPKDTGGFVVFAVVNNRTVIDDPKNLGLNETVHLSTNVLPVSTNLISTGEDITKTIPGAVWGRTPNNEYGWMEPCQVDTNAGDTMTFKVFAVKSTLKDLSLPTTSYLLWNPSRMYLKYKDYILAEASLTVKI